MLHLCMNMTHKCVYQANANALLILGARGSIRTVPRARLAVSCFAGMVPLFQL